jgi:hypothetical protein
MLSRMSLRIILFSLSTPKFILCPNQGSSVRHICPYAVCWAHELQMAYHSLHWLLLLRVKCKVGYYFKMSSLMYRSVVLLRTDVSEERVASISRVKINELRTQLNFEEELLSSWMPSQRHQLKMSSGIMYCVTLFRTDVSENMLSSSSGVLRSIGLHSCIIWYWCIYITATALTQHW